MSISSPTKVAVSVLFSGFGVETSLAGAEGEADRHLNSHHNSQHSFARRMTPSSACAMGRQIEPPPLGLPTSLIINDQKQTDRPLRGESVGVACQLVPARWRGRGRVSSAGISNLVSLTGDAFIPDVMPSLTGPGLDRLGHFFSVDFQLLESHFQCVSQANPSHSPNSAAAYVPKHRPSRSHEIGNPSQTGAA